MKRQIRDISSLGIIHAAFGLLWEERGLVKESALLEKDSEFQTLKKNRMNLDPEERKEVMDRKAVWHNGPNGEAQAAVWKSKNSKGEIRYVCNTHRAYQVSPTLKGGIKKFDWVKTTA